MKIFSKYVGGPSTENFDIRVKPVGGPAQKVLEVWVKPVGGPVEMIWPAEVDEVNYVSNIGDRIDIGENSWVSMNVNSSFTTKGHSKKVWSMTGGPNWLSITQDGIIQGTSPKMGDESPNHFYNVKVQLNKGTAGKQSNPFRVMMPFRSTDYKIYMNRPNDEPCYMNIEECQMINADGLSWTNTDFILADQSSVYNGDSKWSGANVFMWTTSEIWHSRYGSGHWVSGRWRAHHNVKKMRIRVREGNSDRAPAVVVLQGRVLGRWVEIKKWYPGYAWSNHEIKDFQVWS